MAKPTKKDHAKAVGWLGLNVAGDVLWAMNPGSHAVRAAKKFGVPGFKNVEVPDSGKAWRELKELRRRAKEE